MKNAVGRDIPLKVSGKPLRLYQGPFYFKPSGFKKAPRTKCYVPGEPKVCSSLDEAIKKTGLQDGDTISFHHHLRNGDTVVNFVMSHIAKMGLRDIKLGASALFPVHEPLITYIQKGVITRIEASLNGPLGAFISQGGKLCEPAVLRSHGGRARAVAAGELPLTVAFLAAPIADEYGNCNGMYGPSAFGAMGYAYTDAQYADYTVILTDNLQPYPVTPISVPQTFVDFIVKIDSIGSPFGIQTGTTEITRAPSRLMMARNVVEVLKECGVLQDGFTFQAGAGGTSLAVTQFIHQYLKKHHLSADFVMGGTTRFLVEMLREGTAKKILEGQSFDPTVIESLRSNPMHVEINNTFYADIHSGGCAVDQLDAAFLGATEIDLDFNVNVNTHSDGVLLHGIGGHQDVAAGAAITFIITPLLRGRIPTVTKNVTTVTTPGETIDVLVTEYGIAINPRRSDLLEDLRGKLPLVSIEAQYKKARGMSGIPKKVVVEDEIVALIEYRDGTIIDVVKKPVGFL